MKRLFLATAIPFLTFLPTIAQIQQSAAPCFTITVESKMWSADGKNSEEHRFTGEYRAGRVENTGVYRSYGNKDNCSVATMSPGEVRLFYLSNQRGEANGRCGKESASVSLGKFDPARNRDVYVTFERKEKGATLEFTASSPLPSSDTCDCCVSMCAAQVFHPSPNVFEFSEEELTNLSSLTKTVSLTMKPEENECFGKATATLNARLDPPDEEMTFVPAESYDSWIPAPTPDRIPGIRVTPPGTPLRVTVKIQPKAGSREARQGKIQFSLQDVTRHKGNTGNYPSGGTEKEDLRFAAEQAPGIIVDSPTSAHTEEKVSEATVVVEALDTAAYGKLIASAPELSLKAIYKPTNTYALMIPRDDDNDRIADSWQRQMGIAAQPNPNADEDKVTGQDRVGDGLTAADEYRGLVILDGGVKAHKRFDPRVKEMFVVDDGGIFDLALWLSASGITAYKVDDSMLAGGANPEESRVVNFNASADKKKYAVRVLTMPGDSDPDDPGKTNPSTGYTACGECRMPKDADYCKVFPTRIRKQVEDLFRWLSAAVTQPGSPEAQQLASLGLPPSLPQQALAKLRNPAAREAMVRQLTAQNAIHEVGHAVSLKDHQKGSPKGAEDPVRECPMYYPADVTYRRFIVLQTLFRQDSSLPMRYTKFCRGIASLQKEGYNCFARINVADW